MASFDLNTINAALDDTENKNGGVDYSGMSMKIDNYKNARPIIEEINECPNLHFLALTGNTVGVEAAEEIAKALEKHPELKIARWSDMFTGRMKTEIPLALSHLGEGMITAGARLKVLDLSDNAFGPIGVEGLARLLESDVCTELEELRLNNNGLGVTGGRLLAESLSGNQHPRLKVFVAGRNRLENEGAKALAAVFQKMGSLEEVAMPQNGIYHSGITALSEAFSHNPHLTSLNLNDNTMGYKGAEAIVRALPNLKSLKNINFGDCLLKSRGALILAQGLKENSVLLECLDLSHNEIGHEACMEVVDAITVMPDSSERLQKVILAGNSLGGTGNKKVMKEKLGDSADLSDGEGSDEEYVTGSEEESGSEDEESPEETEDSATEDAQHLEASSYQSSTAYELDTAGVEEIRTDVGRFIDHPSLENFRKLGPNAVEIIDTHLLSIMNPVVFINEYVEVTQKIAGLTDGDDSILPFARAMYEALMQRAGERPAMQWTLANSMLVTLGLMKSEDKNFCITWNLTGCYKTLATVIDEPFFSVCLTDTLKYFINAKKYHLAQAQIYLAEFPDKPGRNV